MGGVLGLCDGVHVSGFGLGWDATWFSLWDDFARFGILRLPRCYSGALAARGRIPVYVYPKHPISGLRAEEHCGK